MPNKTVIWYSAWYDFLVANLASAKRQWFGGGMLFRTQGLFLFRCLRDYLVPKEGKPRRVS